MAGIATFLRYAFGLRTIGPVGVTGLAGWATIWQLNMSVTDPDFWVIASLMLLGCFVSWAAIAYDAWKKEKESAAYRAQIVELAGLVKSMRPDQEVPYSLRDLGGDSNAALKAEVAKLVRQMRTFATNMRGDSTAHFSGAMREGGWDHHVQEMLDRNAAFKDAFNQQFRPLALGLRSEMRKRLGIIQKPGLPGDDYRSVALDLGMLAGPDPVGDAAAELESLAQQLSD